MRKFDELKVSTRTIIASADVEFEIEGIFRKISIENTVDAGSSRHETMIETMYYKDKMRTVEGYYQDSTRQKSFRNALNIIMMIDGEKKINFKVSKNGKFQLTGCKDVAHAKIGVCSFLEMINRDCPDHMLLKGAEKIRVFFEIVMTNMDCGTGYCINRKALDGIINSKTTYHSLLETSFGYTGVNIKFPLDIDWFGLPVPVMEWMPGKPGSLVETERPLEDMKTRPADVKKKYNTFLVFHSGQFIMSGMHERTMRDDYQKFMSILSENHDQIREHLDVA
jgi:TATA-box binding protein (TBP) (component of TFIID and TFIIIB)